MPRTKYKNSTARLSCLNLEAVKALAGNRTMRDIAESSGLSATLLSRIFNGHDTNPTGSTLIRLARGLECQVAEIMLG